MSMIFVDFFKFDFLSENKLLNIMPSVIDMVSKFQK